MKTLTVRVALLLGAATLASCDCGALPLELPDSGGSETGGSGGGSDVLGGGSGGGGATTGGGGGTGGGEEEDAGETYDGGRLPDGGCAPFRCVGRCGPIRDFCTGTVEQCGGCDDGGVCNLATNRCGPAQVTCTELGAQCGQLRNSCGTRLNCGACPTGQECDRNTNTCVTCRGATCQDLGFQCGMAYLGCGPFTNLTNCGSCAGGSTCNALSNTCEPSCTPASKAVLCAAAGADCGLITNGCGGSVDCGGCPSGQQCGARGIGNRCDVPEFPDECLAANRECGPLVSACGPTLSCGDCSGSDVCRANGRCGPACTAATCGTGYLGQCGTALDAGCESTVSCGCSGGSFCSSTTPGVPGTCQVAAGCTQLGATGMPGAPCSNGRSPSFDAGAGQLLSCGCVGSGVCIDGSGNEVRGADAGTCCVNTATCPPNACARSVQNTCTGAAIACTCGSGASCDTSAGPDAGVCVSDFTCATYGATGGAGSRCSNGPSPAFPRNGSSNLTCRCSGNGNCYSDAGVELPNGSNQTGRCCTPLTAAACPANSCTPIVDPCTGESIPCTCASGRHCNGSGSCIADDTCGTHGANGQPGEVCSNGPSFSNGATPPTLLTCRCTAPNTSCTSGGAVVSGATRGTCCQNANPSCSPSGGVGNRCNQTVTNSCTGASTTCGCNSSTYCGPSNTCVARDTCTDVGATGALNSACSNGNSSTFPRFPGDTTGQTCSCTGGLICTDSTPSPHVAMGTETGQCCQPPSCPANSCASIPNPCTGQTMSCSCGGGTHCSGTTCVADKTCTSYNANGDIGRPCSTVASSAFPDGPGGANLACACSTSGGRANNTCVGSSATQAGTCTCTPSPAADCREHGQSDGCGGTKSFPCTAPNTCGAVTPGVCGCRAKTQADCGVSGGLPCGQTSPNGCGGFVTCSC